MPANPPPGSERPGGRFGNLTNVVVRITETATVDVSLRIAAAQQQVVNVEASAPLVSSENAARGTVIERRQINQLPLPTRNFQQLLSLTPGASSLQNSSERGCGAAIYVDDQRYGGPCPFHDAPGHPVPDGPSPAPRPRTGAACSPQTWLGAMSDGTLDRVCAFTQHEGARRSTQ